MGVRSILSSGAMISQQVMELSPDRSWTEALEKQCERTTWRSEVCGGIRWASAVSKQGLPQ